MRICVFGCDVSHDKSVSIHSFPKPHKDPERFIVWVNLVNSVIPSKFGDWSPEEIFYRSKVCSRHFDANDWNRNNRLNALAVPSLNLPDFQDGRVIPVPSDQTIKVVRSATKLLHQNDKDNCSEIEYLENIYDSDDLEESEEKLHEGYKCNICNGDIIGFRYRCVQCSDIDMCVECETRGEHNIHYVLRIPEPRPFSEIHSVLEKIRKVLMSGVEPIFNEEQTDEFLDEDCDDMRLHMNVSDENPKLFEDAIDVKTEASCVKTEANGVKTEARGVKFEVRNVKTENSDETFSQDVDDENWREKSFTYCLEVSEGEITKSPNDNETAGTSLNRPIIQTDSPKPMKVNKDFKVLKRNKTEKANITKKIIELNKDVEKNLNLLISCDKSRNVDEEDTLSLNRKWHLDKSNMRTYKRVKKS